MYYSTAKQKKYSVRKKWSCCNCNSYIRWKDSKISNNQGETENRL